MLSRVILTLCLLISGLASFPVLATDSWTDTFADVAGLEAMTTRVLVVAAADDADARAAEAAFAATLRAAGSTLVLDHSTTGSLSGLDDATILGRTATIPVDVRVVVRVFEGAPPTAVVSAYKADGGVLWAFSARRGEKHVVSSGAVSDSAAAVLTVSNDRADAVEKYAQEFLWIGTGLSISRYGTQMYNIVYQGKYKRQLTRAELHKLIGDKVVFERVESGQLRTNAIGVTALVTGVVAIGLGVAGVLSFTTWAEADAEQDDLESIARNGTDNDCSGASCVEVQTPAARAAEAGAVDAKARADQYATIAVWTATGSGVSAMIALGAGTAWLLLAGDEPAVLTEPELRQRIEAYNLALAKRLGLNNLDGLPSGFSLPHIGGAPLEAVGAL